MRGERTIGGVPLPVSVIIPALNEEARIAATIDAAFAAGAADVVVCDGGSSDGTIAVARKQRARVITGETTRARQLNRGAKEAAHEHLIFLHADTLLPAGAAIAVMRALAANAQFGGFELEFLEPSRRLRLAAFMINSRTKMTRCPWGDQAQFIRRETFHRLGGYADIPIMEDYDLAVRMKRAGRTTILPLRVRTSGRRFLEKGLLRTSAINWRIVAAWRLGVDPEKLARIYRG
ncbi:MAG TPA: TIGR04283 family arsenosugar biosynthesis glycosyltransferase [Thermoanaerobaculia bacterium]